MASRRRRPSRGGGADDGRPARRQRVQPPAGQDDTIRPGSLVMDTSAYPDRPGRVIAIDDDGDATVLYNDREVRHNVALYELQFVSHSTAPLPEVGGAVGGDDDEQEVYRPNREELEEAEEERRGDGEPVDVAVAVVPELVAEGMAVEEATVPRGAKTVARIVTVAVGLQPGVEEAMELPGAAGKRAAGPPVVEGTGEVRVADGAVGVGAVAEPGVVEGEPGAAMKVAAVVEVVAVAMEEPGVAVVGERGVVEEQGVDVAMKEPDVDVVGSVLFFLWSFLT
ncbi:hypothetical protein ACHAXT_000391 [Thalassiosira profunda]